MKIEQPNKHAIKFDLCDFLSQKKKLILKNKKDKRGKFYVTKIERYLEGRKHLMDLATLVYFIEKDMKTKIASVCISKHDKWSIGPFKPCINVDSDFLSRSEKFVQKIIPKATINILKKKAQILYSEDKYPNCESDSWVKIDKKNLVKIKIHMKYPHSVLFISNDFLIRYYICYNNQRVTLAIGRRGNITDGLKIPHIFKEYIESVRIRCIHTYTPCNCSSLLPIDIFSKIQCSYIKDLAIDYMDIDSLWFVSQNFVSLQNLHFFNTRSLIYPFDERNIRESVQKIYEYIPISKKVNYLPRLESINLLVPLSWYKLPSELSFYPTELKTALRIYVKKTKFLIPNLSIVTISNETEYGYPFYELKMVENSYFIECVWGHRNKCSKLIF